MLSKKRSGPIPRDSERTKGPLFRRNKSWEASFNLVAFTQAFSSKFPFVPLMIQIWAGLEAESALWMRLKVNRKMGVLGYLSRTPDGPGVCGSWGGHSSARAGLGLCLSPCPWWVDYSDSFMLRVIQYSPDCDKHSDTRLRQSEENCANLTILFSSSSALRIKSNYYTFIKHLSVTWELMGQSKLARNARKLQTKRWRPFSSELSPQS